MGDPACWLNQVCLECGRFLDTEMTPDGRCPHCGAEMQERPGGDTES